MERVAQAGLAASILSLRGWGATAVLRLSLRMARLAIAA